MYLRCDTKKVGKKKRSVRYLSLAHAVMEDSPLGKRSKPIIFASLGNEEKIDKKMAQQLRNSLDKYIEQRWDGKTPSHREVVETAKQVEDCSAQLARQRAQVKGHSKSMCKVASHMNLGRLVKPSAKLEGAFVLDQDAIRREELLAGVRFYRTTLMDWDAEAAWDAYGMLQEVEANHRTMKGPLRLRPCYHRTTERIEAHVMLTILAANCVRYLERATGRKYLELLALFKPMKAILLDDGRSRYWQRSELTPGQIEVLETLQLPLPPTTWDKWIELEKMRPKPRKKGPASRKGQ